MISQGKFLFKLSLLRTRLDNRKIRKLLIHTGKLGLHKSPNWDRVFMLDCDVVDDWMTEVTRNYNTDSIEWVEFYQDVMKICNEAWKIF